MSTSNFSLIRIIHSASGPGEWFDLRMASQMSGMHPEMIREFARARMVESFLSLPDREPFFDSAGIRRLQQIEQLRFHQRVNLRTIRLIVRLLDRLDSAEDELQFLRDRMR